MSYRWDTASRRFRNAESGRYVSASTVYAARQGLIDAAAARVEAVCAELASGDLSVEAWTQQMRAIVKQTTIEQYLLGHGGVKTMTQSDWGRIGYQLREQYGYLQNFAHNIDAGGALTDAQIAARAVLYVNASWVVYEQAHELAWNVRLPARPGDGSTPCRGNCRCAWRYEPHEDTNEVWVFWQLDPGANHCDECVSRSQTWAPLIYPLAAASVLGMPVVM